jgi:hypothetical protein
VPNMRVAVELAPVLRDAQGGDGRQQPADKRSHFGSHPCHQPRHDAVRIRLTEPCPGQDSNLCGLSARGF